MAKLSELVRGFRANVREGIPTVLAYDGTSIKLNCSPNINGYVGLATRKGKYEICDLGINCKECVSFRNTSEIPSCKHNLTKRANFIQSVI